MTRWGNWKHRVPSSWFLFISISLIALIIIILFISFSQFRHNVNDIYFYGYCISLTTLIISLIIFLSFRFVIAISDIISFPRILIEHFNCRSLRCTRIRIHVQLFTSLALSCILWIVWYKFVIVNPDVTTQNPTWCISLHIATQYLMISSYFWMFCEGMHLHLVLVVVFIKDNVAMRIFMVIGWGIPVIIVAIYSFFRSKEAVDST